MLKLPENFENYADARKAGFLRMKDLKEAGKKVVGTYCTFVPTELVEAAGGAVVSLCASSEEPIPAAENHLPRNLCPLIKASYGFALQDTCPYFYFSDFIVGETTCDGKKKMFELMNEIKETYVMQLPSSRDEAALDAWEKEVIRFWKKIEDFYGIKISEEDVKKSIEVKNRERDVMLKFLELGKLNPAPISGYEIGTRLDALGFNPDIEERCRAIEERTAEVLKDWEENYKGKESKRPRVLVTGCPNSGVREKTIRVIEEMGVDVVAFDCCNGTREKVEKVDTTIPVTRALAEKYLNINCSIMSPNTSRMDYIKDMIKEYQVEGVMELVLTACHTYAIESHYVRKTAAEMNVPYLGLEVDFSSGEAGQISTRLSAFVELLQK